MKLFSVFALALASVALGSPAATSLERSIKLTRDADGTTVLTPCVECPCTSFEPSSCKCVPKGCCCH
ncbi:hypothetical protein BU23DRAFT_561691 [Bimuria novae-zelandiae CBS 107.79]|uniref:Metallothionein n=1 Tax=Bimuria novae-zelandiae CBS 107.79 TaxID=1447943 RepID=A0A6A5UII4_9PLEO|nr:hypothetical protein BU23DRAFT_561691 [Bimuria novae-zelandiae CBS 107.79]